LEDEDILATARRFVQKAEQARWDIASTDEPQLVLAKAAMVKSINRRLNIRIFSIKWIMRALDCSAKEADAIRDRRYTEFTAERLTEMNEQLTKLSD
jgi:hypothetical protein